VANEIAVSGVVAALSVTSDLTRGHPPGEAMRACLLATELARRAGLDPATTHRLAATLVEAGFLSQPHPRGGYRLGSRLLELGFIVLDGIEVRRIAFPYLVAFHAQTHPGSASSLLVPDGRDMLNVERLPPREWGFLFTGQLGYRFPMHASAAGKAYLAALPPDEARALLARAPLARWTRHTVTDVAQLMAELEQVREQGYGISDEEVIPGSRAIAAAILDAHCRPVAALLAQASVDVELATMIATMLPRLVASAAQISAALGYRRPVLAD
jgi:DNA-binding IclR family transcriptional regulator